MPFAEYRVPPLFVCALLCAWPLPAGCGGSDSSRTSGTVGGEFGPGGAFAAGGNGSSGLTVSGGASTIVGSDAKGGTLANRSTSSNGTSSAKSSSIGGASAGGSSSTSPFVSSGGTNQTGGAPSSGGITAIGGTKSTGETSGSSGTRTTGGSFGSGGAQSTGSTLTTGGTQSSGGTLATGGVASSGGTRTTGGSAAAGGTQNPAGTTNTGGTSSASSDLCSGAARVIIVDSQGSGQYKTIQAAIDSIPSNNTQVIQVNVKAGTYAEQVTISKPFVCLVGESTSATTITHTDGTSITTGGTVMVNGNDFSARNITFENSAANGSGQAVALMAKGSRQQFRDCRFVSYQDTLYTNTGTQYFKDCYIQGDTDYIFGDATAVFENCTMNNVAEGTAVTAPRTPQGTPFGLVFLGGSLTANPTTSTVRANHVYLGRPWGPYGAVAFLNVSMDAHINVDGWTTMSGNDLTNVRFYEYKSTGAGANPTNATRANRQLSDSDAAQYTVANVLKPWVPTYSK
jgi:pectin methylesterase-like acyl-CoA thioesterase